MIFLWLGAKKNITAAALWRKKSKARTEQLAMCAPAQINIWSTLWSGYYLAEISGRRVGGLAAPFYLVHPPLKRLRENSCLRLERNSLATGSPRFFTKKKKTRKKGALLNRGDHLSRNKQKKQQRGDAFKE